MKKSIVIISLLTMLLIPTAASARIRCGNDIISKGDSAFEVKFKLRQCGELFGKEVIQEESSTSFSARIKHRKSSSHVNGQSHSEIAVTERWYIVINERGGDYCWTVIFKRGELYEFEDWERCN